MGMQMPFDAESAEPWLDRIKPEILKLTGYAAPLQGQVVAKLNQNENPFDLPPGLKAEILEEMRKLAWFRYPEYNSLIIREKLGRYVGVGADQILLGHGSNQLLYLIGTAIIQPQDRVVLAPPTFSLFNTVIQIFQSDIMAIEKKPDFSLDETLLLDAVRSAKLTILCSPDNPTGRPIETDFLENVLASTPGLVLWDEAYAEFWGKTAIPLVARHPNLLIIRTFSKSFGLAGLRVGYLIGSPSIIRELQKVNIPYNLNLFSGLVAGKLLDNTDLFKTQIGSIIRERQRLFKQLKGIPRITPFPSEANFILFRTPDGPGVLRRLQGKGVLVRNPGDHPLLANCLRVTVGTPEENQIFIETLKTVVSE